MPVENLLFLFTSVTLSACRNITSKKMTAQYNKKSDFYLSQAVVFGVGSILLILVVLAAPVKASPITCLYGVIYGVLLILSQWMLTIALKTGNTSVCSVLYSLGFILPTVSGTIFWDESFTLLNGIGIVLAVLLILFSAQKNTVEKETTKTYIPYIVIAMFSAGGLGIMQKVQGKSDVADEKSVFLLIGFVLAFSISLTAYLLCGEKGQIQRKTVTFSGVVGFCFGGTNLFNTILAGKMNSAVFFPLQNISTVLLTTLFGMLLVKEKMTLKTAVILLWGISIIIVFSI